MIAEDFRLEKSHTHSIFLWENLKIKVSLLLFEIRAEGTKTHISQLLLHTIHHTTLNEKKNRTEDINFLHFLVCVWLFLVNFFSTSTFVRAQHLRLLGGLRIIYQLSLSKLRGEGKLEWNACSSQTTTSCHDEERTREQKKLEIEQNYTFNTMFDISCEKKTRKDFS